MNPRATSKYRLSRLCNYSYPSTPNKVAHNFQSRCAVVVIPGGQSPMFPSFQLWLERCCSCPMRSTCRPLFPQFGSCACHLGSEQEPHKLLCIKQHHNTATWMVTVCPCNDRQPWGEENEWGAKNKHAECYTKYHPKHKDILHLTRNKAK